MICPRRSIAITLPITMAKQSASAGRVMAAHPAAAPRINSHRLRIVLSPLNRRPGHHQSQKQHRNLCHQHDGHQPEHRHGQEHQHSQNRRCSVEDVGENQVQHGRAQPRCRQRGYDVRQMQQQRRDVHDRHAGKVHGRIDRLHKDIKRIERTAEAELPASKTARAPAFAFESDN